MVQDRIPRMLIGAGEQLYGLYFFRGMEFAAKVSHSSGSELDLWHNRLEHPSSKALYMLHLSDLSSVVSVVKNCDVCIT